MNLQSDILCVVDLCVDLILTGDVRPRFGHTEQLVDGYFLELGGSASIFAGQFARLGGSAGVIGAIGDDAFGRFVLDRLEAIGVDTSRVRRQADLKTGIGVTLSEPDDRAILTYSGSIDATSTEHLTDDCTACRHWHLASFFLLSKLRDYWPDWLRRLRGQGVTVSLDTNWDPAGIWDGVRELLPLVDVFLPNAAEAKAISGLDDVHAAGRALAESGPLVVVKRGDNGALAFRDERVWESTPASVPEDSVCDTIGAGDCFDAGFIRAWLLDRPIEECLELAARCGAASLAAPGGFEGQLEVSVS